MMRNFQSLHDILANPPLMSPQDFSGDASFFSLAQDELMSLASPTSTSNEQARRRSPLIPISTSMENPCSTPISSPTLTPIGFEPTSTPTSTTSSQIMDYGPYMGMGMHPPPPTFQQTLDSFDPFYNYTSSFEREYLTKKRRTSGEFLPSCNVENAMVGMGIGNGDREFGEETGIHVKNEEAVTAPKPCELSRASTDSSSAASGSSGVSQQVEEFGFEFTPPIDPSIFNNEPGFQSLKFQPFQESTWNTLADESFQDLAPTYYRVDADKGFNFSTADDAFVCQKKNHFQITCFARQTGVPRYVKTADGFKPIDTFYVHFYGVKVDAPNQTIRIEQSQSDRTKKAFHPIKVDLTTDQVAKSKLNKLVTVGRLHFNETTSNNMRKKGKPNPEQRYFYLVVALQAHCKEKVYPIVAHASVRIIVRASNPGQFEGDVVEQTWQKGQTSGSICHIGRVGVNTDRPDEALVVYGNCRIAGQITHPSDGRVKMNIREIDSRVQLQNVQRLRVVGYKYKPEVAIMMGLTEEEVGDTGVIAQEVQQVIPDAVKVSGDLDMGNGRKIENLLVVNKERIFMENIGAVKELSKLTEKLENRLDQLERLAMNCDGNVRDEAQDPSPGSGRVVKPDDIREDIHPALLFSNRAVQALLFVLICLMAICLIVVTSLYIAEYQERSSSDLHHNTQVFMNITNSSLTNVQGISNHFRYENIQEEMSQFMPQAAIGKPVHCSSELTKHACKVFCCDKDGSGNTEYDVLKTKKLISMETMYLPPRALPAGGEDSVIYTNQKTGPTDCRLALSQSVEKIQRFYEQYSLRSVNFPNLTSYARKTQLQQKGADIHRQKRGSLESSGLVKLPSVYVVSKRAIYQRLDPVYCSVNSSGYRTCASMRNGNFPRAKLTYQIPLSKYWDERSLYLIFNVSSEYISKPEMCETQFIHSKCTSRENLWEPNSSVSPTFSKLGRTVYSVKLDVGTKSFAGFTIRYSANGTNNVCILNSPSDKFFEFKFYFYRVCTE